MGNRIIEDLVATANITQLSIAGSSSSFGIDNVDLLEADFKGKLRKLRLFSLGVASGYFNPSVSCIATLVGLESLSFAPYLIPPTTVERIFKIVAPSLRKLSIHAAFDWNEQILSILPFLPLLTHLTYLNFDDSSRTARALPYLPPSLLHLSFRKDSEELVRVLLLTREPPSSIPPKLKSIQFWSLPVPDTLRFLPPLGKVIVKPSFEAVLGVLQAVEREELSFVGLEITIHQDPETRDCRD